MAIFVLEHMSTHAVGLHPMVSREQIYQGPVLVTSLM